MNMFIVRNSHEVAIFAYFEQGGPPHHTAGETLYVWYIRGTGGHACDMNAICMFLRH